MGDLIRRTLCVTVLFMLTAAPIGAYQKKAPIRWQIPLTWEDGQPLNPELDLSGYEIWCGTTAGAYTTKAATVAGGMTTETIIDLPVGSNFCIAKAVATSANGGGKSKNSNEASKIVDAPTPSAPTGCSF